MAGTGCLAAHDAILPNSSAQDPAPPAARRYNEDRSAELVGSLQAEVQAMRTRPDRRPQDLGQLQEASARGGRRTE